MPPTPAPGTAVRPSAVVNERIRALFRAGRALSTREQQEHWELLQEYTAAVEAEERLGRGGMARAA